MLSRPETQHITAWNPCFQTVIWWVLQPTLHTVYLCKKMNKYTEPLSANSHSPSPAPPFGGLPLPAGEGSEYPYFLLENRARRPCSTIVSLANQSRTVASVPRPPATKSPPNPSQLERGVNTLTSCWRTEPPRPPSHNCINIHFWGCLGAVSETHRFTLWKHGF